MARRYNISVTQEDIDRAKRNDSYRCVVVQAVARTIPTASGIRVDTQTIRFRVGNERLQFLTPNSAAQYVVDFDAGDKIEPFTFHLRDPRVVAAKQRTEAGRAIDAENKRRTRKATGEPTLSDAGETSTKGRKPTRSVFGATGRRMYGQRMLRYNRDRAVGFVVGSDGEMIVTAE